MLSPIRNPSTMPRASVPPGDALAKYLLASTKGSPPMPVPRPLRLTFFALGLALAAAPAALHAQAQATTGVIRGTVTDSTGGADPFVAKTFRAARAE